MHTFWTSWTFLWIVLWVFIWPLFLIGIRRLRGKNNKTPLDVLKERYAKGEIDKAKFDEMKKDL